MSRRKTEMAIFSPIRTALGCAILMWFSLQPIVAAAGQEGAFSGALITTADPQYQFGEALFQEGDMATAIAEFKRFLFLFPDDSRAPRAALRIGQCQTKLGNTEAAVAAFERVAGAYPKTPSAMTARFLTSDVYRRTGQSGQALINYRNMMHLYPAPGIQDQIRYRMAWIYIETGEWQRAAEALAQVGAVGRGDLPIEKIQSALNQTEGIPQKNPSLAGALSIIPGMGQLYTGRNQDAAIAFLLNAGLIWAAVEAFDNELYALGTVITVVEIGFYSGNIYSAVGSAHKYNARQKSTFIENLKMKFNVSNDPFTSRSQNAPALGLTLALSF